MARRGKISAIRYARENGVPILGICYGLHMMVIEAARNLLNLPKANSTEIDPNSPDRSSTSWIRRRT